MRVPLPLVWTVVFFLVRLGMVRSATTSLPAPTVLPLELILGDFCTGGDVCSTNNSYCSSISAFTMTKRCQCKPGFIEVQEDVAKPKECNRKLYAAEDINCLTCEINGGECYDRDDDHMFDGCVCPVTKMSSNTSDPSTSCDTNYATVTCNREQMTVCYKDINTTTSIHIKNKEYESRCLFSLDMNSTTPTTCLDLSLAQTELHICDTKQFTAGRRVVTYENTVIIQKNVGGRSVEDVEFNAFCNFDLVVRTFSGSITLHGKPIHSEGKSIQPELEMRITDDHLRDVATTGILIGSKAKIVINMTDARDTYQAILPDTCVATNKPSLTTAGVRSLLLIYSGCPSTEQKYIDNGNSFNHTHGGMASVEAGPFSMFKVDDSEYVYFHCTVKVCRDAKECKMPKCDGTRRRKRSALVAFENEAGRSRRAVSGKVSFIKAVDSAAIRVFNSKKEFLASGLRRGEEGCAWFDCLTAAELAGIIAVACVVAILTVIGLSLLSRRRRTEDSTEGNNVALIRVTRTNRSFRFPRLYSSGKGSA